MTRGYTFDNGKLVWLPEEYTGGTCAYIPGLQKHEEKKRNVFTCMGRLFKRCDSCGKMLMRQANYCPECGAPC